MDVSIQISTTPIEVIFAPIDEARETAVPKIFVDLNEYRVFDVPFIVAGAFFMLSGALVAGLSIGINSYLGGWLGLFYLLFFSIISVSTCSLGTFIILKYSIKYKWLPKNFDFTIFHKLGLWRDFAYFFEPSHLLKLKLMEKLPERQLRITEQRRSNSNFKVGFFAKLISLWRGPDRAVTELVLPVRNVIIPRSKRRVLPFDLLSGGHKDDKIEYENQDPVLVLHQKFNSGNQLVYCETLIVDYEVLSSVFSPTITGPKYSKEDRELRVRSLLSGKIEHVETGSHSFLDGVDVYHDSLKFHNLVSNYIQTAPAPSNLNN